MGELSQELRRIEKNYFFSPTVLTLLYAELWAGSLRSQGTLVSMAVFPRALENEEGICMESHMTCIYLHVFKRAVSGSLQTTSSHPQNVMLPLE